MIDSSLIYALLSDYESSALSSHLPEIRDQLAILEATLVPDSDGFTEIKDEQGISSAPSVDTSTEDESTDFSRLTISSKKGKSSKSGPSSSSSSKLAAEPMSRTSTSGTSEHASVDEEEQYVNETELLQALFPAL